MLEARLQSDVQWSFLPEVEDQLISPVLTVALQLKIKVPQDSAENQTHLSICQTILRVSELSLYVALRVVDWGCKLPTS